MNATIITIGDELLIGQVIDTNSPWLSMQLNEIGIEVKSVIRVGDDENDIAKEINIAKEISPIVITTGGLGPTSDDRTLDVFCNILKCKKYENKRVLEHLENIFKRRGLPLTETNRKQALVPEKADILFNKLGTAPGLHFDISPAHFFVLPGVPFEMKDLYLNEVLPMLKKIKKGKSQYIHKTILLAGIGESFLSDKIKDWEKALPVNMKLAYLPSPGYIRLRLSLMAEDAVSGKNLLNEYFEKLYPLVSEHYVNDTGDSIAETLLNEMSKNGKTLCIAESCTGGYVSHQLTAIPGSSKVFLGAVVAYSNEVKKNILNVKDESINNFGAVSADVVSEMATNALKLMKTDYAIAVSGIAGPDGGTEEKPVGTVYIAVASKNNVASEKMLFNGQRDIVILRSSNAALYSCLKELRKECK
ncbi:MAG: competence/damage-inducible protein A [Bacteroidales bacterium]|nr:competence/damage-inducible protein A [Bacteroidales bacterium]